MSSVCVWNDFTQSQEAAFPLPDSVQLLQMSQITLMEKVLVFINLLQCICGFTVHGYMLSKVLHDLLSQSNLVKLSASISPHCFFIFPNLWTAFSQSVGTMPIFSRHSRLTGHRFKSKTWLMINGFIISALVFRSWNGLRHFRISDPISETVHHG